MRVPIVCHVVLAFVLTGSADAAPKMEVAKFQSARGVEITGYYFRPSGDGPFPAVIGMHGCGGLFQPRRKVLAPNRMDWARRFLDAGYVILFADSYGPRGVHSVCETRPDKRVVKLPDHVGDLGGTVSWISTQSFVDKDKIAVVGWGVGGAAVLRILDPQFPLHQRVDLKAAIAFYPPCEPIETVPRYVPRFPPTILMGAADEWNSPSACGALAARWGSPIVLYPGAHHNFDVPNVPIRRRPTGVGPKRAGTNPAARNKAIKVVREQLIKAFGEPGKRR